MVLKQAEKSVVTNQTVWQIHELKQNLLFCQGILQEAVLQQMPLSERRQIVQEWLMWKIRLQKILS